MNTLQLIPFDAGLLPDYKEGSVDWWQDTIRNILVVAHEHYQEPFDSLQTENQKLAAMFHEKVDECANYNVGYHRLKQAAEQKKKEDESTARYTESLRMEIERLKRELLSAAPTPPEVEPVAQIESYRGDLIIARLREDKQATIGGLLYTSPPSTKASWDADGNPLNLEAAVMEFFSAYDSEDADPNEVGKYLENLRKFLPNE